MDCCATLMPMSYVNRTMLLSDGMKYQHPWSLNNVVKRLQVASE